MGYPLTGYLFEDFDPVTLDPDLSLLFVESDGSYFEWPDIGGFVASGRPVQDAVGVWTIDKRRRRFAFRIAAGGADLVAVVTSEFADIRAVFDADLTDGTQRIARYLEAKRAGVTAGAAQDEHAREIEQAVHADPPDLPGLDVAIEKVVPFAGWRATASVELVDTAELGAGGG